MPFTPLRDNFGRTLGSVETLPDGRQILLDPFAKRLGEYDPRMNMTRDAFGRPVGSGNVLTMLLR